MLSLDQELQRKSEELKRHKIQIIKQNIINLLAKLQLPHDIENIILEYSVDESKIETNNSLKKKIQKYCGTENEYLIPELDVSCITSMYRLFDSCATFNLCLNKWDTSNAVDMSWMFLGCWRFNQQIRFNTSKVTNMSYMFCGCYEFNQQIVFDTSNVTDMSGMFYNCQSFNQLINFNTLKVTDMNYMFWDCESLEEKNKQLTMR
jgi:surface protein